MGRRGAVEKDETVTMKRTASEKTDRIIEREDGTDIRTPHAKADERLASGFDATPARIAASSKFGVCCTNVVHHSRHEQK